MVQSWSADQSLQASSWSAGTAALVDAEYHQRWRRLLTFESPGTLTQVGTGAGVQPNFQATASALGYLSLAGVGSQLGCRWSGRRDGGAGGHRMMAWLDDRSDLYANDDLNVSWTFLLETIGGQGTPPTGSGDPRPGSGVVVVPLAGFAPGVQDGHFGSQGVSSIGGSFSQSINEPVRLIKLKPPEPGPPATGWRGWLVGVRLQGSHIRTNGGTPDYDQLTHENVDGYYLWIYPSGADSWAPDSDLTVRCYAMRGTSSSAQTRRALCSTTIPAGVANLNTQSPITIRCEIQNNGSGDPELKWFISPYAGSEQQLFADGLPGSVTADATSVTVDSAGTITDAEATEQLTGQGTICFGGHMDRVDSFGDDGPQDISVVEGLVSFEARDLSAGTLLVRDEFQRVGISEQDFTGGAALQVQDRFGTATPGIECDWPWGNNANTDHPDGIVEKCLDPNEVNVTLYDPTAYWTIDVEPGVPPAVAATTNRRECFSFRPAGDDRSQRRRITFRAGAHNPSNPNYTASTQQFGIVLFGDAFAGRVTSAIACDLLMTTTAAGAQDALVVRIARWSASEVGEAPTLVNILSQTLASPPNLLDGADHTLEFDCHVFSAASPPGGPLVYQVKIDGTAVTWVEDDVAAGKTITITGNDAIDFGPPKDSGFVEGFYFYSPTPETDTGGTELWDPWRAHTWEQLALTSGGGISPDEMASVVLEDEGAPSGQSIDDVLCFEFSVLEQTHDLSSIHRFDSGHTGATASWDRRRRNYRLGAAAITEAEATALRTFWDDHRGAEIPFTWTQDGEAALTVAFVNDSLELDLVGPGAYSFEVELREVHT